METNMTNQPPFEKGTVLVPADQVYPNGALIVDGYDGQGNLLAYPQGGGRRLTRNVPPAAGLLRAAVLFYRKLSKNHQRI